MPSCIRDVVLCIPRPKALRPGTVKKFDEVVRHLHLVTQDQFCLVSKKDSGSHEDNCIKNIEVFQKTFTNVELLRYKHIPNIELFR